MNYHIQSTLILMRNFDGKNEAIAKFYGRHARNFVAVVPDEHIQPMRDAGWDLKVHPSGMQYVVVKIDPEYDTDLSDVLRGNFNNAEIFIEGRPYYHPIDKEERVAAFLISITPEFI